MYLAVNRTKNGDFVLVMSPPLFHYLGLLPNRLREALDSPDYASRAMRRMFPPGYADPEKEQEYRDLVQGDLLQQRLLKIAAFEEIFHQGEVDKAEGRLVIRGEQFDGCLSFLNDLRVLLGEELEIENEDWEREFEPGDPRADKVLMLHLLGYIEQGLLEATGMVDFEIDPEDL
jgi:hypothetical protein